ncbi:MAG: DUF1294 domain-containing protein [Sulfurovum sp.]|nr:DUF1294 domain-containing protein [Sulfurovum sp.]
MILFTLLFTLALLALVWTKLLPSAVLVYYVILGLITFFMYKKDKNASLSNSWRVSEKTLHLLSLLGGWIGAVIAQKYIRHKTQKRVFKIIFFITIFINLTLLAVLLAYTSSYIDR